MITWNILLKIADAKKLVTRIEREMKGKFPRPFSLRLAHFQLFGGNLQKIVGIEVTDNVKDAKPPSIERLNEAVTFLKKLSRETEAEKLTLQFYARMIELGKNDTANFVGLAKQYFKVRESEKALQTLQQMIDFNGFGTLKNAAEICTDFRQTEKAVEFRRRIAENSPLDFENRFELSKLLPKDEAVQILQSLVNERNASRGLRWQVRVKLHEFGEITKLLDVSFDAYSQFYDGVLFNDENYFVTSLIADNTLEAQQLQELIKLYAINGKPFAALKLVEIDKTPKSDDLFELLSKSAETVGEFQRAIDFEKAKTKVDNARIETLQLLETEKNKRVTSFAVDAENTRKL
jgi:hypothetical protein